MADKIYPISRKQYARIDALQAAKASLDLQLNELVLTVLSSDDSDIPPAVTWRTQVQDGVHALVASVPDIPRAPDAPDAMTG